MTRIEILQKASDYTDLSGLMAPGILGDPIPIVACDNGLRYLSEYHILLHLTGLSTDADKDDWERIVGTCMIEPGLLKRYPGPSNNQEQMDDHLAVCAAAYILNRPNHAKDMLSYGFKHLGFFNTQNPGKFTTDGKIAWNAFTWRMPQIVFATAVASGAYKWYKPWYWLAYVVALFVTATSANSDKPLDDIDSRGLTWLLSLLVPRSFIGKLAINQFLKYLYESYPDGLFGAYKKAYGPDHVLTDLAQIYEEAFITENEGDKLQ